MKNSSGRGRGSGEDYGIWVTDKWDCCWEVVESVTRSSRSLGMKVGIIAGNDSHLNFVDNFVFELLLSFIVFSHWFSLYEGPILDSLK